MRILLNGLESEIAEQLSVAELIDQRGLNPNTIVVEHNLVILPRQSWPETMLADGDKLEIIAFVGGG